MDTYTVTTREGVTLLETTDSVKAFDFFVATSRAYAIYKGVDLVDVK